MIFTHCPYLLTIVKPLLQFDHWLFEKINQVWIDVEHLVPVRFLKYDNGTKEEGTFEDHIPLKGGWSETKCSFYRNDHLLQVEKYHDVMAGGTMDPSIFDPANFRN